jgi:hypothetical protein
MVKEAVQAMIQEEMQSFAPSSSAYLAHLPYPKLKFANSAALQVSNFNLISLCSQYAKMLPPVCISKFEFT